MVLLCCMLLEEVEKRIREYEFLKMYEVNGE